MIQRKLLPLALVAFLLLPAHDNKIRSLKLIAIVFALGNFLFGVIAEYRIWFELIPFSLYAIEHATYPRMHEPRNNNATP